MHKGIHTALRKRCDSQNPKSGNPSDFPEPQPLQKEEKEETPGSLGVEGSNSA